MGYPSRGRHQGSLPRLRLDVVCILMATVFLLGIYVPTLMMVSNMGSLTSLLPATSMVSEGHVPSSAVHLSSSTSEGGDKLGSLEEANRRLKARNDQLELDDKLMQSNLKSLNKNKNEEIKKLEAKVAELEKECSGKKQEEGPDCGHVKQELDMVTKEKTSLQDKVNTLTMEVQQLSKAAGVGGGGEDASKAVAVASIKAPSLEGYWGDKIRDLFDTWQRNPAALLAILDNEDPFGVHITNVSSFACPDPFKRLTVPEKRNMGAVSSFLDNKQDHSFIFFQHLRKAGGTAFCDMAERNMRDNTPHYFCMPDDRGSLATPPWNTKWLLATMAGKDYRIAANEWDAFQRSKLGMPNAVFVTMMRDPVDRWYSQYRFEHLEHRDGSTSARPFPEWYKLGMGYNMGNNYYVKTFVGEENPPDAEVIKPKGPAGVPLIHGDFYWTYAKYRRRMKWDDVKAALDTLLHFHLILILEWIDDSHKMIQDALGWIKPPRQILPHEKQAQRESKKSKTAKESLSEEFYKEVRQHNALDYLLLDFSKRIFLERYSCGFFS